MTRKQKGFTLIELLIVVAIIGILAAIAIPNLLTAMQRSKQKRTMADIRNTGTAWEARATDMNKYNAAGAFSNCCTINANANIVSALSPTYIKLVPTKDGWNNAMNYQVETGKTWGSATLFAQAYQIWSPARDNSFQGSPTGGGTTDFSADIIFSNGVFIQYPEGIQSQ